MLLGEALPTIDTADTGAAAIHAADAGAAATHTADTGAAATHTADAGAAAIHAADAGAVAIDIGLGLGVVLLGSAAIGATAPRWPTRWLRRDRGPTRLLPGDTPERYERLGARRLKRFFPEMGAVFGGVSKNIPPDFADPGSIRDYLAEVRRAEWVHWLSMLTPALLPLVQPWWLAGLFLVPVTLVNGSAEIILRYNKIRLYGLLDARGLPREG
jgi:hypothetical protein